MRFYRNFIALNLLAASLILGQHGNNARLAQAYERGGNYEEALTLYLNQYAAGKIDFGVINGIKKCYTELHRYPQLIDFLHDVLRKQPGNVNFAVELGGAYYLNQQKEQALEQWQGILKKYHKNAGAYRLVARKMTEYRLLDEAVAVYQKAVDIIPNQQSLYRDMAYLRRVQLDYAQATRFLLQFYFHQSKQLNYIRSQLIAMAKDDQAAERILEQFAPFEKQHPDDAGLLQLKATMLQRRKQYAAAFAIYQKLGQTHLLLQFAQESKSAGAFRWTVAAYERLSSAKIQFTQRNAYRFESASALYQWALKKQNQGLNGSEQLTKALSILESLSGQTGDRTVRWRSLALQARIQHQWNGDRDRALQLYQQLISETPRGLIADRARLEAAAIFRAKNTLPAATKMLSAVKSNPMRNRAGFELAELNFFQGQFSRALAGYEKVLKDMTPNDTLFNNLFSRRSFVQMYRSDSTNLARYAQAELMLLQQQTAQSARVFWELSKVNSQLAFNAGLRAAELSLKLQPVSSVLQQTDSLAAHFPDHPDRDKLYLLQAELLEKLGHPQQALSRYLKLIAACPNSFYLSQARERARAIRSEQESEIQ